MDWHVDLHMSLATQTADAKAGLLLLVAGFVGQGISAIGVNPQNTAARGVVLAGAAGVAVLILVLLRVWLRPSARRDAFEAQLLAQEPKMWPAVIRDYAFPVGDVLREGAVETPAARAERLLGRRRWRRVVSHGTRFGRELPESLNLTWHPDHDA